MNEVAIEELRGHYDGHLHMNTLVYEVHPQIMTLSNMKYCMTNLMFKVLYILCRGWLLNVIYDGKHSKHVSFIQLTNSLCCVAQISDKKISGHIQYGPPLLNSSMGNLKTTSL